MEGKSRGAGRSIQEEQTPFTIHNLPYGIITSPTNSRRRCATAFLDFAVDLEILHNEGLFKNTPLLNNNNVFSHGDLNAFAAMDVSVRLEARKALTGYLSQIDPSQMSEKAAFIPLSEVQNHFPMDTRNFSDFYCSLEHTRNCTDVFNPGAPINPNWFTCPMVYNGRTSSLVVSDTPVTRPCGVFPTQISSQEPKSKPVFQPEIHLDFELEMGVFVSESVPHGTRLDINKAKNHIFGFVMLNDWSARNIQVFEMPPLGPFHSKGFATSISPWVVPMEALDFVTCPRNDIQEPPPPAHLYWTDDTRATFDIEVSVKVLREGRLYILGESNVKELHWTPYQQITHLASAGEGLSTGDIFGTGTISSSRTDEKGEKIGLGCLFERKLGRNKLTSVPEDIVDTFLKDGDEVILEGWGRSPTTGEILFGFGQCRGKILPAHLP